MITDTPTPQRAAPLPPRPHPTDGVWLRALARLRPGLSTGEIKRLNAIADRIERPRA